jgi:anti-sigma28 factor (negative regulator of flagellin synthesis)
MNIKNIDLNVNYISNPYKNSKLIKNDSVKTVKSSFSNELNKVTSNSNKVDKIEISQKPVNKSKSLSEIRENIVSEIKEDKDVQYIDKLKDELKSHNYLIDADELAEILLL